MIGSLLAEGASAAELAPVWRAYWSYNWHRVPDWPEHRLGGFLEAAKARQQQLHPGSGDVIVPAYVNDFPDGRAPFLGILTLASEGSGPAKESGALHFPQAGHLLTIAPTRTGKGACHIVPNLLLYAGSAVVIDVKGENYATTSAHRQRQYEGSRVIRFAPFSPDTDRYNPLDFIRRGPDGPSDDTFDDARLLADMLIPGKTKEEYWDIESRNLVTMLLAYVASRYPLEHERRTLAEVANLLFATEATAEAKGIDLSLREIMTYARSRDYRPLLALVTGFLEHESKVRSNILSSCRADMRIWNSEHLRRATSSSDFTFGDLKASMCRPDADNPAPTTLYIIIPPEYLHTYRAVVRMMIGLGTVELTRPGYWSGWGDGWRVEPPCPVLFLLDELPILGHMEPIVNGLSYLAGYGVQLWSFAQNIGQLKQIYGEAWHNFPANAGVTTFFGVNDPETAEYVVKLLGESDEVMQNYYTKSTSSTDSKSSSYSTSYYNPTSDGSSGEGTSSTLSEQQQVRFLREPLARVGEIRSLHPDLQLTFIRNTRPILSTKLPYYQFPLFEELYGEWKPAREAAET